MATDLRTDNEQSVTRLVTGIISDIQDLFKQQLALLQNEIERDFHRTKDAVQSLAVGVGISLLGLCFLMVMLVYLLHWLTELPLWGCFGIVGGLLTAVGGILYLLGKKRLDSFNPLPDETAQAAKENIQCLMNPK